MPDKVGLLGFDNTEWAQLASPSVSSVVQPAHREGEAACDMLIDLVEGNEVAEPHQVIRCGIVWGSFTL
jgi:DNA-binding LacI/PurR family transcriptional regulator